MQPRSAILNVMTAAAQKAARGLVRDFGEIENLQVSKKGPADFVSNADKKAEKTLVYELSKARPNFGFLLEEGGEIEGSDTSNRWIIDPLDGTSNFLHGLPHFSISIALERDGEPFAGVIYEPVTDQMFAAENGIGAYLNNRRLRVSARTKLEESLFATGIPFAGKDDHDRFLTQLKEVMAVSAGVRRFGSAALDLAYVAAGRFEGFWEIGLQPWDIAAGIVLVREAGGFVTDVAGGNGMMESGEIIAANYHLHGMLLKSISAARR
ncbi:MAG: Inositol-1-monophosphatase [Alphaproteobacteria bacterium MarineAlpha3_Bin1]|nr:MAG: Inositol-1-monophosphatase [Alphaproteobacteria bacterium MarineAlpha3_Bin1]